MNKYDEGQLKYKKKLLFKKLGSLTELYNYTNVLDKIIFFGVVLNAAAVTCLLNI